MEKAKAVTWDELEPGMVLQHRVTGKLVVVSGSITWPQSLLLDREEGRDTHEYYRTPHAWANSLRNGKRYGSTFSLKLENYTAEVK